MTLKKRLPLFFSLIAIILLVDFTTKWFVQAHIPYIGYSYASAYPYSGFGIFDNLFGIKFAIIHNINRGAAWGILSQWQQYLLIFRIALILFLIVYTLRCKHKGWDIPLTMIIGGAIGNVLDYFFYGHVIDMFQFVFWGYEYPTFNVADASIFLGIAALLILSWKQQETKVTKNSTFK